jgi:hypothetical protein
MPGPVTLLITQVVGQLGGQTGLEHPLDHLRQEPALAGQPQLPGVGLGQHPIQQPRLDHGVHRLTSRILLRHRRLTERSTRFLHLIGHMLTLPSESLTQTI